MSGKLPHTGVSCCDCTFYGCGGTRHQVTGTIFSLLLGYCKEYILKMILGVLVSALHNNF